MLAVFIAFIGLIFLLLITLMLSSRQSQREKILLSESQKVRDAENLQMFDQRCHELKRSLQKGEIDQESFDLLEFEAKAQLLVDTQAESGTHDEQLFSVASQKWILLGGALLAVAVSLYIYMPQGFSLGAYEQHKIQQQLAAFQDLKAGHTKKGSAGHEADPANPREHLDALIKTLEGYSRGFNPDEEVLHLLAQAYRTSGRHHDASQVYQRLLSKSQDSAFLLAELAESQYLEAINRNGHVQPVAAEAQLKEIQAVLQQALDINPEQPKALSMAGMMSFHQSDYDKALSYWRRALPLFSSSSAEAATIRQGIAAALERSGRGQELDGINAWVSVSVVAELPEMAKTLPPSTPVFIFARAVNGPPMPLAAKRLTLQNLPASFLLTNQDQMAGIGIDEFDAVSVQARVSLSGQPIATSGDFESQAIVTTVIKGKPSEDEIEAKKVELTVAKQVP